MFSKKRIAEEDVEVFKIVYENSEQGIFKSYYNDFLYEIGNVYKENVIIPQKSALNGYVPVWYIDKGLHSYSKDVMLVETCGNVFVYKNRKCFNSYYVFDKLVKKLNCIIPKGSEYYKNEHGEIVSNYLKIVSSEKI